MSAEVVVRRARTPDVRAIRSLVEPMARSRRIVSKDAVAYYEAVHEFRVVEVGGEVVGCGALHVMWEDLAEVRTVAVAAGVQGSRAGLRPADRAAREDARDLGVQRVFCLTFEIGFFGRHGFQPIDGQAGRARGVCRAAPVLRRGRRRVPGPGTGQAQHPRQHPDAAHALNPVRAVTMAGDRRLVPQHAHRVVRDARGRQPDCRGHGGGYRHHGLDARYLNCEVPAADLADAVRGARAMGWAGFNCSIPHKVTVIDQIDGLAESARIIGAVNCVVTATEYDGGEHRRSGLRRSAADDAQPAGGRAGSACSGPEAPRAPSSWRPRWRAPRT